MYDLYLEIYIEKLHRECERLYKQGYSDGVNNTIKDFEKENNNFKLCGKEHCKECEEFGWTCDLTGVAKDGYWTCNIMNTMLAVNNKEDKPTPLDFLESDIIFREEDIKTSQQDIYKAVLGLDAPENALTTVQEMNEKAKEVVDIMNDCPKKCEGRTCFEAFNREDYKGCPNLIHKIDDITKQHKFHCTEKHVTIGFTVDAFINKCKTIMPRDFKEEK